MTTATSAQATSDKVFVCKYVGKPGVNEVLQTGNNPISVSTNALGNAPDGSSFNGTLPFWFSDAQGRSVAFKFDERQGGGQQGEPPLSECPSPPRPPDKEVDPPGKPATEDPCGPGNIRFVGYSDGEGYTWSLNGGSLTATPLPGYRFKGGSQSVTHHLPADSNVPCPKDEEPTPVTPVQYATTDPTCEAPGSLVVKDQPTGVTATQSPSGSGPGAYTITFTAAEDFVLEGPATQAVTVLPKLTGEACDDGGDGGVVDTPQPAAPQPQPAVQQPPVVAPPPATVKGVKESKAPKAAKPKPAVAPAAAPNAAPAPAVLGVQSSPAVPTAVSAGLGSLPATGPVSADLLGRLLAAGGLTLLLAAGGLGLGRRTSRFAGA
jgi:hypothetical protein